MAKAHAKNLPQAEERFYKAIISIANKSMSKEDLAGLLRELVLEFNLKQE